ncbi:MAG: hypothetical protein ACYCOU_16245 [Sulfobacillus sp.]
MTMTMKLYKLTDAEGQTRDNTQWGAGVTHSGTGEGDLCGPGWVHAYLNPLVAVLMNSAHADFNKPRLWEAKGKVALSDGTKVGCRRLTTVRELPVPAITIEQRVRFAILCAKKVYQDPDWLTWAEKWLSGADRTKASAIAAAGYYRLVLPLSTPAIYAISSAANAAANADNTADNAAAYAALTATNMKPLDLAALAEEACNCNL